MSKKDNRAHKNRKQNDLELIKQSWSEVDAIYDSIALGIVEIAQSINNAIQMIAAHGYADNQELIVTTKGLNRDLNDLAGELKTIKARHEHHSGIIDSEEEFALSLSVFTDYNVLSDRFKSVVFSPMLTLTEFMSEMEANERKKTQVETQTTEEANDNA